MKDNVSARVLGIGRLFRHAVSSLQKWGSEKGPLASCYTGYGEIKITGQTFPLFFSMWLSFTAGPSSLHDTDSVRASCWSPWGRDGELRKPSNRSRHTGARLARVRMHAVVQAWLSAGRVRSAVLAVHLVRCHCLFSGWYYSLMSLRRVKVWPPLRLYLIG